MEEKGIESLYNRGNKSAHLVPAGSFIISQERERDRERSSVKEQESEKKKKKVIGIDWAR